MKISDIFAVEKKFRRAISAESQKCDNREQENPEIDCYFQDNL
jgi:hypothetical protein